MATHNYAYCCDNVNNNLDVFDITAFTVVTSIAVGTNPQFCAIRPDNSEVWVTNSTSNTISVISVATNTVTATISGFNNPQGLVFDIAGTFAYVVNLGTLTILPVSTSTHAIGTAITPTFALANTGIDRNPTAPSITVSAGPTVRSIQQIAIPGGGLSTDQTAPSGATNGLAYEASGTYVYWLDRLTPSVGQFNVATNAFNATFSTPPHSPGPGIAATPDGTKMYFAAAPSLVFFSVPTWPPTYTQIAVTDTPFDIAITGDGTQLVYGVSGLPNIRVYALPGNTLAHSFLTTGASHKGICTTPLVKPTPVTLTVPGLFIPRKGFDTPYTPSDFMIDWLAIERWANSWAPTLVLPAKSITRTPSIDELDANWLTLEVWADTTAKAKMTAGGIGSKWVPLLVPRKTTDRPIDLTTDWLRIQEWANGL